MDPARLPPEALVRIMKAAGSVLISPEKIAADLEAGAPRNADGTIHLVRYAAWLAREVGNGD